MNENPEGNTGGRRLLLIVGALALGVIGAVIFATLSMVSSGGGGRALTVAQNSSNARPAPAVPPRAPSRNAAASAAPATPAPSPTPAPSASAKPSASPKATPSPGAKPTPKPRVTPKPAPTPSAVARRPAPGRAAVVAQVRQGNASQPIGPPPVDLTPVAARTPAPVPAATPPPTPTPAPTGAPKVEDARFLSAAAPEEVVEDSQRGNTNFPVTVVVDVTVGTNGRASGVRLERSSGNQFVDRNALAAARASTYAPAKVDGKPSVSSYRAVYEFR